MISIEKYICLSREDRRAHLDLDAPCQERGGDSKQFRGLLAFVLDTSIPTGFKIYLCHACHNGKCSNPKHMYWGTPADNHQDQRDNGTYSTINQRKIDKYGVEKSKEMNAKGGRNRKGRPGKKYSLEQIEINRAVISQIEKSRGWISKCASELGISHTQLRRFINAHAKDLDH